MIAAIREQVVCERWPDPVEVHSFFRFEIEAVTGETDTPGVDGTSWPTRHQYGDEDKLRRNLLDALTQSALIFDDALVVGGQNWKRWVREGEQAGVVFVVRAAESDFAASMEAAATWLPGRREL